MTGTALSFIVELSIQSDGQCACEITTDHGVANVAGAATTALFTGGLTLLTAGIGMADSNKMEERIVLHLEQLLSSTRSAPSPQSGAWPAMVGTQPLVSSESEPPGTLTSDAVVDGLAKAGGFLWSTAKAVSKGVVWLVSYKCPKCNEADYTQKQIGEGYDDFVGTAYRGLDGQLRKNWSQGSTQVQVRYLRKTTLYELTCKKCGTVWTERSKQEVIA
jgi:predicted nucleic-acid-binding Zn-ribbon protein